MGTRGAWGFRVEGKDKLTYNHWDSYPSGLGKTMIEFIQKTPNEVLEKIARRIILVNEGSKAPIDMIKKYGDYANLGVSSGKPTDWYCLLRETQGKPEAYHDDNLCHMIDSHRFLGDSLFCEWAYILNMDTLRLEVYVGFNKNPKAPGRYAKKFFRENMNYKGVILFHEISFDTIRYDFGYPAQVDDLIQKWNQLSEITRKQYSPDEDDE